MELACAICGKRFNRKPSEVKRCLERGLNNVYCSAKCCGKGVIGNIPKEKRGDARFLRPGNRKDALSPFRWHLKNCRKSKKDLNLTLEDLKEQWDKQSGKCPYTGWRLKIMDTTSHKDSLPLTPDRASLDRIDSSKGYIKGNIQFVSFMAQMAKNRFAPDDVIKFCEAVVAHKS
jgi:hypothetical protein